MPEMPHIWMPDPKNLPDGLVLNKAVEVHYRALPKMYQLNWDSFGDGGSLDVPEKLPVQQVSGAEQAKIANYAEWVQTLDEAYDVLAEYDSNISQIPKKTGELCDTGRSDLRQLIDTLHQMAKVNPQDMDTIKQLLDAKQLDPSVADGSGEITEDKYVMALVTTTTSMVESVMDEMNGKFQQLADGLKPPADKTPKPAQTPDPTPKGKQTPDPTGTDPTGDPYVAPNDDTTTPDSPGAPQAWNWDSDANAASPFAGTTATSADTPVSASKDQAAQDASAQLGSLDSPATSPAVSPATGASTPGFSPADYALPLAMQQGLANMANARRQAMMADQGPERSNDDAIAPVRAAPAAGPAQARTGAPASSAQQGQPPRGAQYTQSGQAANAQAAANAGGQSNPQSRPGTTSVNPVANTRPGGVVVYTFPDGRSQDVSPVVAQALDAAFGNATATDARHAYEKTAAKLPPGKEIGTSVDPSGLITGDIATWDQRNALVVAFPDDGNTPLEVIVEGQMKPFDAQMSDRKGDFGAFTGFAHPAGIEATSDSQAPAPAIPVGHPAGGQVSVPA